jgi:DNA-binding GntR family transcriptional regulator
MADLDARRLSPGQRLVETDLAARFQVGRNAVREAMQHLAARGIIDLSRNRSPAIRMLSLAESFEVLEVAEAMLRLAARGAAARYDAAQHADTLGTAVAGLEQAERSEQAGVFARARRHFYRTLLATGGNRELQRLFPAIGMHILHVQYASPSLQRIRARDYAAIAATVQQRDETAADLAARTHVENVRVTIRQLAANQGKEGLLF